MLRLLRQRRVGLTSISNQCNSPHSCKSHVPVNHNSIRTHSHSHSHSHSGSSSHGHSHHQSLETNLSACHLRQCRLATIAGGCTNVFFSTTKIWLGSAGGSVALVADGFHALTDIIADVISFVCITFARKSFPRCRYPFGIGRMETAGAVIVAAILLFGGLALLMQSSQQCYSDAQKLLHLEHSSDSLNSDDVKDIHSHSHSHLDHADHNNTLHEHHELESAESHAPSEEKKKEEEELKELTTHKKEEEEHGHTHGHGGHGSHGHSHFTLTSIDTQSGKEVVMWSMVLLAGSSVICKELLFQWTRKVGMAAGSRVVVANAYHHRADAWSGAVALLGVGAQCAGIPAIDGLAGLVVSLSIIKIGYSLLKESVMEFFDYQGAEVAEVRALLQRFYYPLHHPIPNKQYSFDSDIGLSENEETKINNCELSTEHYNMQRRSPAHQSSNVQSNSTNANNDNNTQETNECTKSDNNSNNVMDTKPIRFINAFLTRHGHAYCLLVTLLVPTNTPAIEIQRAINELTTLTRQKVEIHETFFKVLVCSETEVLSRSDYVQLIHTGYSSTNNNIENSNNEVKQDNKSDVDDEDENMKAKPFKNENVNHIHDSDNAEWINSTLEHSHPHEPIAATGELINPSLEQCICTLNVTHHFTHPIRYSWEKKEIYIHDSVSMDCYVDVLSVAEQYSCTLVTRNPTHNDKHNTHTKEKDNEQHTAK